MNVDNCIHYVNTTGKTACKPFLSMKKLLSFSLHVFSAQGSVFVISIIIGQFYLFLSFNEMRLYTSYSFISQLFGLLALYF